MAGGHVAGVVELMRPLNGLMAGVAVLVGAFVSRSPTLWGPAFAGALSAFAAAGAANALNDRFDVEADRIHRPARPIPSGRAPVRTAASVSLAAGAASIALATLVGPRAVGLAAAWFVLTTLYSRRLKGVPFVGNVVAASVAATPFLMGGFSQSRYLLSLVPCVLAFFIHLARELVKDVEDVEGDAAAGVRTLAVRKGPAASYAAARAVLVVVIGLAALPFAHRVYGWGYAAVVRLLDAALVWLMATMERNAVSRGIRRPSSALKAVMAAGLLAFVLGVLWPSGPSGFEGLFNRGW